MHGTGATKDGQSLWLNRRMSKGVVLITGASSGIGASLAAAWAGEGWDLGLLARRADRLSEIASEVGKSGRKVIPVVCDVTDVSAVREAVSRVESEVGPIDVAVANAGVALKCRATRFSAADAETIVRTNLLGMLYLYDAVMPGMIRRKRGHFVGIASLAGLRGLPGGPVYSASKAGMQAFLEGVRPELRARGIIVTTVNPGFVKSEITRTNDFPMPFLLDTEEAAERIVRGVERGDRVIEFPLPMRFAVRLMRHLPNRVYDYLILRTLTRGRSTASEAKGERR